MRNRLLWLSIILIPGMLVWFGSCKGTHSSVRENLSFNSDWRFELNDAPEFKLCEYVDTLWRKLDLPHDWSIEGKFDSNNPAGIRGGGLPGGIGWYRKTFTLPSTDSTKRIYITFDGIYHNSEVYINGTLLGKRPNGYVSFQYDLTPFLLFGDHSVNIIAVRVDNSDQPNSRWYSGSGIYRNVWLLKTHPIHINQWGTHILTPNVTDMMAEITISIAVNNTTSASEYLEIETQILDHKDKIIVRKQSEVEIANNSIQEIQQTLTVNSPALWSIENPYLYKAISYIRLNKKVIDISETTFGIRYFNFDSDSGFTLNGKRTKILGVCNHHDLGALGAAVNTRAIERQLEILKEMGCNGIRTSHNPPSPELLDLCDRMGFIVMNETFDCWAKEKVEYDYSTCWKDWHIRDLTDHLFRDRNHPSVFIWSIGNEIQEQYDSTGVEIARELAAVVRELAPNIPVTSACNFPEPGNYIIRSGALDLIGVNYHHQGFETFPQTFKGEIFIGAETTSSLSSRGSYDMPSDSIRVWPYQWDIAFYDGNPDQTCSSYDNCHVPWGSTHAETWNLIKKHDYLSGLYIWTGFDYIGEPTPYQWPSRSSYFGIIDLAGFPKDAYYLYQSEWTNRPVLHLFPHWNWESNQDIDVWAYTNFEEVELFVNGVSQGKKSKQGDELNLVWRVKYEPGTLQAIGKNANREIQKVTIQTAGEPCKILLCADRDTINADGKDLSFISVSVLDKDGNLVPYADNLIQFEVDDLALLAGVDNGNQTSHESFVASFRTAYNGKCLAVLKSKNQKGISRIRATSAGLESAELKVTLL
ncbi:MAG: sugar-binding domain-containing protein [Bacteroidota bacterium]